MLACKAGHRICWPLVDGQCVVVAFPLAAPLTCVDAVHSDRSILIHDVRAPAAVTARLDGHKQEVCGLKWSPDYSTLASGGNDNKVLPVLPTAVSYALAMLFVVCCLHVQLLVWNAAASTSPVLRYSDHNAAVKAIAWSPHQHGLLASGGGTADRCIRFWNTISGAPLQCVDTGSQVCNIMWSKSVNEMVSTHGYSLNQMIVWKYPSMSKVATLTGHTYRCDPVIAVCLLPPRRANHPGCLLRRVLYLAMSPDGQTVVTGAGDETLRFWNVFPGPKSPDVGPGASLLFPGSSDIR